MSGTQMPPIADQTAFGVKMRVGRPIHSQDPAVRIDDEYWSGDAVQRLCKRLATHSLALDLRPDLQRMPEVRKRCSRQRNLGRREATEPIGTPDADETIEFLLPRDVAADPAVIAAYLGSREVGRTRAAAEAAP